MSEPLREVWIDKRMESYDGYLPDNWTGQVDDASKGTIALYPIVVDLILAWRTTAYTAMMPATAIKTLLYRGAVVAGETTWAELERRGQVLPARAKGSAWRRSLWPIPTSPSGRSCVGWTGQAAGCERRRLMMLGDLGAVAGLGNRAPGKSIRLNRAGEQLHKKVE